MNALEVNTAVLDRLAAIEERLTEIAERQRKTDELIEEMTPIARLALSSAITRFDEFEKKGYFALAREAAYVAQRVVETYKPDDVRAFGDAIVGILDTVRTMTQPEVLSVLGEATEVLAHADDAEPLGLVGMVRATRQEQVQKGMAVMLELLKKLGDGATAARRLPTQPRARASGPMREKRRVLGIERTKPKPAAPAACAVPAKPAVAATILDGVAFTAEGHLVDSTQWTPELGKTIAESQNIALTDAHLRVIEAARGDFASTGVSPNIRRLTQIASVTTKDLYALFPKAPGRTIAKIAGLPKPAGCL